MFNCSTTPPEAGTSLHMRHNARISVTLTPKNGTSMGAIGIYRDVRGLGVNDNRVLVTPTQELRPCNPATIRCFNIGSSFTVWVCRLYIKKRVQR